MTYRTTICSPLGELTLTSNGEAITALWLEGQKYFAAGLDPESKESPDLPIFQQAEWWLTAYFERRTRPPLPPLSPGGSEFRKGVWDQLREIPFGQTRTYGDVAKALGSSPRAVGIAVGHNPISILIPCHRVVGADGSLTGYAGGVEKKRFLLELEGVDLSKLYTPKKGTAL